MFEGLGNLINNISFLTQKRLSPENPSTSLSNPEKWFVDWVNGGRSASAGISVSEESSLNAATVFACVKVISETLAELDLRVFRKDNDSIRVDEQHPLYWLLLREPSPLYNKYDFIQTLATHANLWGNAYARIHRNTFARPIEFEIVEPWRITPKRLDSGSVIYEINHNNKENEFIRSENMIHIKNLSTNGLVGRSPISLLRESIGNTMAQDQFEGSFYKNGANATGVMMTPTHFSETAAKNLNESFKEKYAGLGKQHQTILLEDGVKYQQLLIPQSDAQFIESKKLKRSEIAGAFRVPSPLIQDHDKSSFNNIIELDRQFAKYCISPWATRIAQEFDRKIFREDEKRKWFTGFDLTQITKGDEKTLAEIRQVKINSGQMTPKEARDEDNRPFIEGSDKLYINSASVPIEEAGIKVEKETA